MNSWIYFPFLMGWSLNVYTNKFFQRIQPVNQLAKDVDQQANQSISEQPEPFSIALEELRNALDKLQTSEKELRQQNEELLKTRYRLEAECQRYQELFEFAPDGYLVTDTLGTIQEVNQAAALLLNTSPKFIVGKPLCIFIADSCRRLFRNELARLRQFHQSQEWIVQIQPKDGLSFDAALTVAMVCNQDHQPVTLRWLLRDITARRQAQLQIQRIQFQNLQLVEASRLKSQFLGMMSHELRTPMNAILGFSQLLLRQFQQQSSNSQQAKIAERILKNAKHLLRLIEDILDFSRMEAERFELKRECFDVSQLVTATVEEFRAEAEQKHLELQVNLEVSHPQVVNDSTRLRQILTNLLSNAIKFTESGWVVVRVEEIDSDRLAFSILDTGIGIAESELALIFREFRQVNQTISREYEGTGLGLAIVDALVHLMNGSITVESQVGIGSIFRVELPRQLPA
ncbi:MAG: ATP-binding protein [Leptolyngbyaceae bacterium]|nr:ATP-binding protein [Leptolyngbyaceae bacterium]